MELRLDRTCRYDLLEEEPAEAAGGQQVALASRRGRYAATSAGIGGPEGLLDGAIDEAGPQRLVMGSRKQDLESG